MSEEVDTFVLCNKPELLFPGTAASEKLFTNMSNYLALDGCKNWRYTLSNMGEVTFHLDGEKWMSVIQYVLCMKYKNFPIVVEKLKRSTNSFLCGGVDHKYKNLIKGDELSRFSNSRKKYEEDAIRAKFDQNEYMKRVLLHTYTARLVTIEKYIGILDCDILMRLRAELIQDLKK